MRGAIYHLSTIALTAGLGLWANPAIATPRDTARCPAKRDPSAARRLASALPGSAADAAAADAMRDQVGHCVDAAADLANPTGRLLIGGALAEQFFLRENQNIIGRRFTGFDPARLDAMGYSETLLRRSQGWPPAVATISCAAGRDPQTAYKMLYAKAGSIREMDMIRALTPAIERCVDRGERIALDRRTVRAIVARYLYTDGFADAALAVSR